jgi:hypothetical protein
MSGDPPTAFAIGEATVDTAVDDVCGRDFGGRALPGRCSTLAPQDRGFAYRPTQS